MLAISVKDTKICLEEEKTQDVKIIKRIDEEQKLQFLELMNEKEKVLKGLKEYDKQTDRRTTCMAGY